MKSSRVPIASTLLLLASAFPAFTFAQTTFGPHYTAFSEDPSFTEPPPFEILQADLNGDGVLDFIAAQGNQELLSNSSGGYTLHHFSSSALEGGDMPLARRQLTEGARGRFPTETRGLAQHWLELWR